MSAVDAIDTINPIDPSWPVEARHLVERAMAAHGGRDAWLAARRIDLRIRQSRGSLLILKGRGRTFEMPCDIQTYPHERLTVFVDYPRLDERTVYGDRRMTIEGGSGQIVQASADHRRTFSGVRKLRRWRPIDAAYFFGYAVWHYHTLPFTLLSSRFVRTLRQGNLTGVDVEFAPDVPTHCRRQQFWFDATGRVVRHDYVADVIGPWARGCHLWEDFESVGGLLIARRRRVVARLLGRPIGVVVLEVLLTCTGVRDAGGGA
jgi:hypothetical protein